MAKRKWYVVTVGKAVGVFTNWLEVAPLVNGVSGALHQSFSTEEEAERVFEGEKKKGNVKVIGRGQLYASPMQDTNIGPQSAPHAPSPRIVSSSPPQTTHSSAPAFTKSSPPMHSTHRVAQSSRSSSHLSSPATGVTYIIDPTTPLKLSSPRATTSRVPRSPEPRATVHTPSLLDSYPSYASSNPTPPLPAKGKTSEVPLLSPLNSPKLRSQGASWRESYGQTSNRSPSRHGPIVNPNTPSMMGSPRSGPFQCQHTCRLHCNLPLPSNKYSSRSSSPSSFGISQSPHVLSGAYESGADPRSPMMAKTKVPVATK